MARGDRLAVGRRFSGSSVTYTHLGIDVGDGTVVHARPDAPDRLFDGGRIVRTTAAEFAAGADIRVVDEPPARFGPDEIVDRALALVGREGYCPVGENCEHFATWCATGERGSRQVDLLAARAAGAGCRLAAVVAARMASGAAGRVALRTAIGTTVRCGLRTLVPATLAAEGAALMAEWTAHQAGRTAEQSRRAGESAGLVTSAVVLAAAAAATGPAGIVSGALAGAALWIGGSAATGVVERSLRGMADRGVS